jgi:hypothetical protein
MRTLVLGCLVFLGCGFQPLGGETSAAPVTILPAQKPEQQPDVLTGTASIENGTPYDGCSYPLTINGVKYAASPATRDLVAKFATAIGTTTANITYRITGGTASVECGWGSGQLLPEIQVLSLSAAVTTGLATISHGLPFDGCSYPITLASSRTEYAPSPSSRSLVAAAATRVGEGTFTIDYVLTGATSEVECGWGAKRQLPEIDVKAIRP